MNEEMGSAIILLSFRRPKLTQQALTNLLSNTDSIPIYVSIDGEASWSTISDVEQRRLTISVVEKIASAHARVRPIFWQKGEGLTPHVIRIMDMVFTHFDTVVLLEEDHLIGREGIQFLLKAVNGSDKSVLATAYSSCTHPQTILDFRVTAFPDQWGTSFNLSLYEAFRRQAISPDIRPEVIRRAVSKTLESRVLVEGAVKYWFRLINSAALSHSHGDALLQYVAWETDHLIKAPLHPLVEDLSFFHIDALHPRIAPPVAPKSHDLYPILTEEGVACRTCDRQDLRVRADIWMRNRMRATFMR